ncbi:MAG: FG-GAP-like repeat-containing protein [Enhygromyxa sp.]
MQRLTGHRRIRATRGTACGALLLLTCTSVGCSRLAGKAIEDEAGSMTGDVDEDEHEHDDEHEASSDTDEPLPPCSSEWDCEVGERCVEGSCSCVGCGCQAGNAASDPEHDNLDEGLPDPTPYYFDIHVPACAVDSDCDPFEYCEGVDCVQTTACTEDAECHETWGNSRYCIEDLCRPIYCYYQEHGDSQCPADSICHGSVCTWVEDLPECLTAPQFDRVVAHTLADPEGARIVILDLDADGLDDLAVLDEGVLELIISSPAGFDAPTTWTPQPGGEIVAIARGDVHGDGIDELLIGYAGLIGVEIVSTAGALEQLGFVDLQQIPEQLATLDLDFDGLPELVTGTVLGDLHRVEALLGDGLGGFSPLWHDEATLFEFLTPYPSLDDRDECRRTLATLEPIDLGHRIGGRRFTHERLRAGHYVWVRRAMTASQVYAATASRPLGQISTAPLAGRGMLVHVNDELAAHRHVEIPLDPGAVALVQLQRSGAVHHALVDHGQAPASFVEFVGEQLDPSCRGVLELPLDATTLQVGDFDGDGREDLLARAGDGKLWAWFARD